MLEFPFPPGDQKNMNACTAFAVISVIEYLITKQYSIKVKLSEKAFHKSLIKTSAALVNLSSAVYHINYGSPFYLYDQKEEQILSEENLLMFSFDFPHTYISCKHCKLAAKKESITKALQKKHPILTAVKVVEEIEIEPNTHAVVLIGEDKDNYFFRNSWGNIKQVFRQDKKTYLNHSPELILFTELQGVGNAIKFFAKGGVLCEEVNSLLLVK